MFLRGGGLQNAEHLAKYNAVLKVATEEAAHSIPFAGSKFRNFN